MGYVDLSAYFNYKQLLTYQDMNQLGANDETRLSKTPDRDSGWIYIAPMSQVFYTHGLDTKDLLLQPFERDPFGFIFVAGFNTYGSYGVVSYVYILNENVLGFLNYYTTATWMRVFIWRVEL